MGFIAEWRALDRPQRSAFTASFLGWTLDAFDFFLMVFILRAVATEFGTDVKSVSVAVTLTLAMRPLGALFFGALADRFGRRPVLVADVVLFSVFELLSAFAPTLPALLGLRALFGFAMGGEWGIGASLALETLPASIRGTASGLLQQGYATGYLLASVAYGLLFDAIGWRGLFAVGVLPALLALYIRRNVEESPAWHGLQKTRRRPLWTLVRGHAGLFAYVVLLMTAFNFLSHGTQDLFPTFLQDQHHLSTGAVSAMAICANVGAIGGGVAFGTLSQRVGRRRAVIAAALLTLPVLPLWAYGASPVAIGIGAFLLQIAVQGAWGVVPAHLNELSPPEVRGTFPGFAYQLGNFLASANATIQAWIAEKQGGDYRMALAGVAAASALAIVALAAVGREAHGATFDSGPETT